MTNSKTRYVPPSQRTRRQEGQNPIPSVNLDEANFPQLQSLASSKPAMDYSVLTKKEEEGPKDVLLDILAPGWIQITCNEHNRPVIVGTISTPEIEDDYDTDAENYLEWFFERHEMEKQELIDTLGYEEYKRLYKVEFPEIVEEPIEEEEEEYSSEEDY